MFLASCKKTDVQNNLNPSPTGDNVADKIKDSSLLYARDIYLWYSQIPTTFNARNYADPDKIMTAIRSFSMEPGFSQAVDKWSFAYEQQDWDDLSGGITQDFGLNVFFRTEGDLRVKYVERSSPAGRAGIRRGWRIMKINGSSNLSTSNAEFIINAVYQSNSSSFTFQKPDGTTVDLTLSASSYQEHPVMADSIYATSEGKVGYLVFNSFLGDTTEIYNEFNRVFGEFASANIKDVVIDLRYNGGGYVTVQEKLANYLINTGGNGQLMMKQQYNDKYSQYNSTTNFRKLGTLNASRVFFIVSNSTASASELLINNLKPYMDVKLVGPSSTYGKPVGFFPIPVGNWYIFPVSFRTTNKNGEGNYFNGIEVESRVADGLDKDWGDINESALASVFRYVQSGAFRTATSFPQDIYTPNAAVNAGNKILDQSEFKGIIDPGKKFR